MLNPDGPARTILSEVQSVLEQVDETSIDALAQCIQEACSVFVIGMGRSGLIARTFAMRVMHLGKRTFVVGEAITPAIGEGDVLVTCSSSGETSFVCHGASVAKKVGARVAAIIGNRESQLAELADVVLVIPRTQDSVQFGGSLFEQCLLLALDSVVMKLQARLRESSETMASRHANIE